MLILHIDISNIDIPLIDIPLTQKKSRLSAPSYSPPLTTNRSAHPHRPPLTQHSTRPLRPLSTPLPTAAPDTPSHQTTNIFFYGFCYISPRSLMGEAQKRKFLQKTRKVFKRFAEWQNDCFPVSKQTDALPDGAAPKIPFPLSYAYARNARRDFLFTAPALRSLSQQHPVPPRAPKPPRTPPEAARLPPPQLPSRAGNSLHHTTPTIYIPRTLGLINKIKTRGLRL